MGASLPERAAEAHDLTPDMSLTASSDLVVTMVLAEVASFCLTLAGSWSATGQIWMPSVPTRSSRSGSGFSQRRRTWEAPRP